MGIYERDYYRQGRSGFGLGMPRTAIVGIILVNLVVFGFELMDSSRYGGFHSEVANKLAVHAGAGQFSGEDTLTHPWMWWQFLTYGFTHSFLSFEHIVFNMLALYFLGRDVEAFYGTREFIRIYLATIVFSGLVWALATRFTTGVGSAVGASGAISGVVLLYAMLFPRRMLLVRFVLPMPAWLVGALFVAFDILGAMHKPVSLPGMPNAENIAYTAHLGGAAFALMYFYFHWNFGRLFHSVGRRVKGISRPSLKVFSPEEHPDRAVADEDVDRILEKIHREGEKSLTRNERRIMESASREYQQRRRTPE